MTATPTISNKLRDPKLGVTYNVLATRPLTRDELLFAVRFYLAHHKAPARGSTLDIISTI